MKKSTFVYFPPPVIAALLLGAAFGINRLGSGLPQLRVEALGILLIAAGMLLGLSALTLFRRDRTTVVPHGLPSLLVVRGPYGWTRNPMYIGFVTILSGLAFYLGPLPFYLVPPLFLWVLNAVHVPHEEATLSEEFGDDYRDYRRKVWRWL